MRIKVRQRSPWRLRTQAVLLAAGVVVLGGVATALVLPSEIVARLAWVPADSIPAKLQRKLFRALRSQRAALRASPDKVYFDIKFKDLQQLQFDREQAVADGVRNSDDNTWVGASIRYGEEEMQAKVRLKGALGDHWEDADKLSLLVKIKGDATYKGMKRFSIQAPGAREFIYEWLFLEMLREEGLIALRIEFVEGFINGESKGIFTLEEQIGKRLIEHNSYREGPIVGYSSAEWLNIYRSNQGAPAAGTFETATVESTQAGAIEPGSAMDRANRRAISLLEGFRRDQLPPSDVFELSELARLAAIYALFGASEFDWRDLKFYLNPVTNKLSPIGKEIHHQPALFNPGWWQGDDPGSDQTRFVRRLFDDDEFVRFYVRDLQRLSAPEYLEQFLDRHAEAIERNMTLIATEAPWFQFPSPDMATAQAQIRAALRPWRPVHAHVDASTDDTLDIEIASVHHFPVELLGLVTAGGELIANPSWGPVTLPRRLTTDLPRYQTLRYGFAKADADAPAQRLADAPPGTDPRLLDLSVRVRVLGLDETRDIPVAPEPRFARDLVVSAALDAQRYPPPPELFVIDETRREIACKPGDFEIRKPIVLSAGYHVRCGGAIRWDLRDEAFVLSFSPVEMIGSAETPIRIESSDQTGAGFAIVNAGERSRLSHVHMSGLSTIIHEGWTLTGALTFYQSPVDLERCHLSANVRGDDMLNIIRSEFVLDGTDFSDIRSDAFDSDFSQGRVIRGTYRNIGGDGIDTSGSNIEVVDVLVVGAKDKAMSFGEHSVATVRGAKVRDSNIGIASKDLSRVDASASTITDTAIGFAAFQKKPEFGPARLVADAITLENVPETSLIEVGSVVIIDGHAHEGERTDVKARIYGPELQ